MFFDRLKREDPRPNRWPAEFVNGSREVLNQMYDICIDTLDSWVEAHMTFDKVQGTNPEPQREAHEEFGKLCRRALRTCKVYPNTLELHTVAYVVLAVWIEYRQEELAHAH